MNSIYSGVTENIPPDVAEEETSSDKAASCDQAQLSALVRSMIDFSRKHKAQHKHGEEDYERRQQLYDGKFYDIFGRFYEWQAEPEANIVKPVVDAIHANVTDTRAVMKFIPKNERSQTFADLSRDAAESVAEDAEALLAQSSAAFETGLHGYAVIKETWQPSENDGQGRICRDALSLRSCYFDPKTRDNITFYGCRWFVEVRPLSLAELRENYGDVVDGIQPGVPKEFMLDKPEAGSGGVKVETPVDLNEARTQIARLGAPDPTQEAQPDADTVVIEAWLLDVPAEWLGQEEGFDINPASGRKEWKCVYFGGIDYQILDWQLNPYRHGYLPYTGIVSKQKPGLPYGEADADVLEGNQQIMNSLLAKYIDILSNTSNPSLLNSLDDGDENIVTTSPGQVMRPNKVDGMRWLEYNGSAAELLGVIQLIRSLSQVTSGVMDVLLGERPRGVTTAEGLRTLEERAMARLRPRIRLMGRSERHLWIQQFSLMQQYFTQERFLAKASATEEEASFVRLNQLITPAAAEEYMRRGLPVGVRRMDDGSAEYYLNDITQGEFDIRFVEGAGLPPSRTERSQLAMELFQMNAIRRIDLLRSVDFPNAVQVDQQLTQMEIQRQQAEVQAEMQQQQMKNQGNIQKELVKSASRPSPQPRRAQKQIFSDEEAA